VHHKEGVVCFSLQWIS